MFFSLGPLKYVVCVMDIAFSVCIVMRGAVGACVWEGYMAHACFYVCCSDCVVVCGNDCYVAAFVKDNVFQPWNV